MPFLFFMLAVCRCQKIAAGLTTLAMTEEPSNHRCHCEERSDVAISEQRRLCTQLPACGHMEFAFLHKYIILLHLYTHAAIMRKILGVEVIL